MKKFFITVIALFLLTACGAEKKSAPTIVPSSGVNLETCALLFDGCNQCQVENGQITACTRESCDPTQVAAPRCLESIENNPIEVASVVLNANRSNYWYKTQCQAFGGLFFVDDKQATKKCVGITSEECPLVGGNTYDDCASPCDYLPEKNPNCTQECIGLCFIDGDEVVEKPRDLYGDESKITFDGFVPNQVVAFPLFINGKVDFTWPFEGVFGIKVLTERKKIIAEHYLTANEWGADGQHLLEPLDFYGEVYAKPAKEDLRGFIRFHNANPSGMIEHAEWFDIPVRFR